MKLKIDWINIQKGLPLPWWERAGVRGKWKYSPPPSPINVFFIILFLMFPLSASPQPQTIIEVGKFSGEKIENKTPSDWKPLTFKKIERQTAYSLVKEGGTVVVKAVSESSASGLVREIKIDPDLMY